MSRLTPIVWSDEAYDILDQHGVSFKRHKTPRGWRKAAKETLLPPERKQLKGSCFLVSLKLALAMPDVFWYCEGIAEDKPHAWISPIVSKTTECIDVTWSWYTLCDGYRAWGDLSYWGVRFKAEEVKDFLLKRLARLGKNSTSLSVLKYPDEITHLIQPLES